MSTAAMFQIITNDGKQDRMLMASDFLRNRLISIQLARQRFGYADTTPTLMDIEKTHILYMNAHFKPFCSIGFEYIKVLTNSGNPQYGSQIQFSIPQYGDFFFDMFAYVVLKQPTLVPDSSNTIPSNQPLMRWCAYPGERLFQKVDFTVNGNPMDTFYTWSYNFYRQSQVHTDKLVAYNRCMGQEPVAKGFVDQPNWANSGVAPADITSRQYSNYAFGLQTPTGQKSGLVELLVPLLFWFNMDVRLAIPSIAIPYGQRFINCTISPGNLLCDLYPRGTYTDNWASPGGSLDYSNGIQSITLYINNIFVNKEIHDIFIRRIGFTLIRVHQYQNYPITTANGNFQLNAIKWPVEYGWMGFRVAAYNNIQDADRRRYLDVWDRYGQVTNVVASTPGWDVEKLTLKTGDGFTIQAVAANPPTIPAILGAGSLTLVLDGTNTGVVFNAATAGAQLTLDGIAGTVITGISYLSPGDLVTVPLTSFTATGTFTATSVTLTVSAVDLAVGNVTFVETTSQFRALIGYSGTVSNLTSAYNVSTNATLIVTVQTPTLAPQTSTVKVETPTVVSIKLTAAGVTIIDDFPQAILSNYLPFAYGGVDMNAPTDPGIMFLNFCLFPKNYQPSGHFNFSRCREFQLYYAGSIFSNSVQGEFLLEVSSLNFLLISDGSAVLRYTT